MINIEDFSKIEIRVGLVTEAVNKGGSDKLIRLKVNFGQKVKNSPDLKEDIRTIFTGVRKYGYTPEDLLGKKFLFVTNLEYRKMMDEESQGMILTVDSPGPPSPEASEGRGGKPFFVSAEGLPVGAKAG